jgi:hypothetical protein
MGGLVRGRTWVIGPGLSGLAGAPAAGDGLDDFYLFAVSFALGQVADEDEALEAGAGPLFGGWVCGGCARLFVDHG